MPLESVNSETLTDPASPGFALKTLKVPLTVKVTNALATGLPDAVFTVALTVTGAVDVTVVLDSERTTVALLLVPPPNGDVPGSPPPPLQAEKNTITENVNNHAKIFRNTISLTSITVQPNDLSRSWA
jgi:hypothetical protein